ncbi:hypothetical protein PHMEG_00028582 [Phytophthora megakarya]|uniref:Reverse transcriptase RNase H-like domain-containing protein n=1 Tax=Phytophthora megakarya TaxID=4795 RepID=A0A225V2T7_9STRA|nr:hypothetical protein PHMEG_00028582 [Phytophthora megakarya]
MLRHPDIQKPFVIIQHVNRWAACAVVGQEYDGKIQPVRYTGRVLNDAELRYYIAEKEVIAILRTLQVQGLINCNQPHLQTHLSKVELLKEKFGSLRLVHLKREYNQAADYLTTKILILDES